MHPRFFCLALALMFAVRGNAQSNFVLNQTLTVSNATSINYVLAADVNADGKPDLVCADANTNTLTIFTNTGHGSFVFSANVKVDQYPSCIAAADVYGNGKVDLISSSAAQHTLTVTTNTGSGFVSNANYTVTGQPYYFAATDLTADGKPDLVALDYTGDGHSSGSLSVLTNNGSGGYVASWNSGSVQPYMHSIAVADFNSDGKPDIAGGEYYSSPEVMIYTNGGKGLFANSVNVGVSGYCLYVVAGDFNGDGKPDLAVANNDINNVTVITNKGANTFVTQGSCSLAGGPGFLAAADMNGDGKLDIVATIPGNNTVVVLTNGAGGFAVEATLPAGASPSAVALADFTGDSAMDVAIADGGTNTVLVYFGFTGKQPLIYSFTPSVGTTGTLVTITGTNFLGTTNVVFNDAPASYTINSNTQITATVPANATTGQIGIFTTNGVAYSSGNFLVSYPPVIVTQPSNTSVVIGQSTTLNVTVSGNVPLTYEWMKNGAVISVSSSSNLTLNPAAFTDSGYYQVIVTNSYGSVTSSVASLFVDLSGTNSLTFGADAFVVLPATEVILSGLTVDGGGHNVTISGHTNAGIFSVGPGAQLVLQGITIADGYTTNGGGIINGGGLVTVNNCTFSNNVAAGTNGNNGVGGAIYNSGFFSTMTINNSTFVNNRAAGGSGIPGTNGATQYAGGSAGGSGGNGVGGGICNDNTGTLIITNCTFYNNQASGGMGGLGGNGYNGYSYQYVCGSYCCNPGPFGCNGYCNNYCTGYVYGGPGGNGGSGGNGYGGSLYNNSGNVTVVNSTFAGGSAMGGSGGSAGSNGAYDTGGSGSSGTSGAGAGGNMGQGTGQFVLKNCIAANAIGGGNFSGSPYTDSGNNLSSDATLSLTNSTSLTNANPNLASLGNNGGATMTLALLPASPAVRAGSTNGAPQTDQRGLPRKSLQIDIGAYETQVVTSSIPSVLSGTFTFATNKFRITFTNTPGTSFSVWSSTNLMQPLANWIWIGFAQEIAPGQFLFNAPNATNGQTFYRTTSP